MLETTYQEELAYLREAGAALSQQYPSLAGMLSEPSSDPDVERLLEGFALVAARLRQRIDDTIPELIEGLTELLLPSLLRPTPAATIVQFQPGAQVARSISSIPAGTHLRTRPVEGTACTFTTTRSVDLAPLTVEGLSLEGGGGSRPELRLRLALLGRAPAEVLAGRPLRLYAHGEASTAAQLCLWLSRHLRGLEVRSARGSVELPADALAPLGAAFDEPLVPWPALAHEGLRSVSEHFTLPEKSRFFEIRMLERALSALDDRFELRFRLADPPALSAALAPDALRLHCVAAVNLFAAEAEPVRVARGERPALLRTAGIDPRHAEVFSVERVVGVSRDGSRELYQRFDGLHRESAAGPVRKLYALTRRAAPGGTGMQTLLRVVRSPEVALAEVRPTLAVALTCSNGALARHLKAGDLSVPTADVPAGVTFANISAVTQPMPPPLGGDLLYRLVGQLACSRSSLCDADVLKRQLELYATRAGDERACRRGVAQVAAIRELRCEAATRVFAGVPARGLRYEMTLGEDAFASEGEAFAFGAMVHRLLAASATLNSFADLRVSLWPRGHALRYDDERRS